MNTILLLSLLLLSYTSTTMSQWMSIPTGHLGIYSVLGQIQDYPITSFSWYTPIYSTIVSKKYVQDSDRILITVYKTSEGVDVGVPEIEVANEINPDMLIPTIKKYGMEWDKVLVIDPLSQILREYAATKTVDELTQSGFHLINDFLQSKLQAQNDELQTGVKINYVRLSQFTIPQELKNKKLELAAEKNNKILVEEKNKRLRIEKEAEMYIARQDSEMKVEQVNKANQMMLLNMEAKQAEQRMQNTMIIETAKANAEKIKMEAEALLSMYSIPMYPEVQMANSINTNQKIYYGEKLPTNFPLMQAHLNQ